MVLKAQAWPGGVGRLAALAGRFGGRPRAPALPPEPAAGAGRVYAYLGPDLALTQLHDGHFIYVDPRDESLSAHLIARGYWERWIEAVVRGLVRPGDRIVEVGANLGYYTLIMADLAGRSGRVQAFEANAPVAALLRRSAEFNGYADRVSVVAAAVGERAGVAAFMVSARNSGGGHLQAPAETDSDQRRAVEVPMTTLDEACDDGPVDLLRMDAEGSELLILAGAGRLLDRSAGLRICMEWDRVQMAPRCDIAAGVGALARRGFRFWRILGDASLQPVSAAAMPDLPACDVVACRQPPFRDA
jgi:FkbM family methyltransferase